MMESSDFDELIQGARRAGELLSSLFHEVTGEELDLESAVRRYPVFLLSAAAGGGLAAGWWIGRRSSRRLPPPQPGWDTAVETLLDFGARRWSGLSGQAGPVSGADETASRWVREGIEVVRRFVPDSQGPGAKAAGDAPMERTIEPIVRQGLSEALEGLASGKVRSFLRDLGAGSRRDVLLDDEEPGL